MVAGPCSKLLPATDCVECEEIFLLIAGERPAPEEQRWPSSQVQPSSQARDSELYITVPPHQSTLKNPSQLLASLCTPAFLPATDKIPRCSCVSFGSTLLAAAGPSPASMSIRACPAQRNRDLN